MSIEKEAYALMLEAQAEFDKRARRIADFLYGGGWAITEVIFSKDEFHVVWEGTDTWGYDTSRERSFPISYFWMTNEQILES